MDVDFDLQDDFDSVFVTMLLWRLHGREQWYYLLSWHFSSYVECPQAQAFQKLYGKSRRDSTAYGGLWRWPSISAATTAYIRKTFTSEAGSTGIAGQLDDRLHSCTSCLFHIPVFIIHNWLKKTPSHMMQDYSICARNRSQIRFSIGSVHVQATKQLDQPKAFLPNMRWSAPKTKNHQCQVLTFPR